VERSYGSFQRTIPLRCEVEGDKVEAAFKKGILTVTLPKTADALKRTKKISITAE
jgi:HSP20 family protein